MYMSKMCMCACVRVHICVWIISSSLCVYGSKPEFKSYLDISIVEKFQDIFVCTHVR